MHTFESEGLTDLDYAKHFKTDEILKLMIMLPHVKTDSDHLNDKCKVSKSGEKENYFYSILNDLQSRPNNKS